MLRQLWSILNVRRALYGYLLIILSIVFVGEYQATIHSEEGLQVLANQLAGPFAIDCGNNNTYLLQPFEPYPFSGDTCAANSFRDGKAFKVQACYARTDDASCYWLVGSKTQGVFFFFYSTSVLAGNRIDARIMRCPDPTIAKVKDVDVIQCLPFSDEWFDEFHIRR
jgi:hypothetical protein